MEEGGALQWSHVFRRPKLRASQVIRKTRGNTGCWERIELEGIRRVTYNLLLIPSYSNREFVGVWLVEISH